MNQKNPPQVLRSEMRADSVPVDEHYSTEGYFYDNPILTRTGIFKYKLEDGSERRELRRPEDVFDPASLASYEGKPIIITHDAQAIDKNNARRERVGTILTPGQQDGETVRAKIVIDDPDAVKASGLRELSVGYYQDLIMEPGEWEGEPYDAIQTHIRVNHLALVAVARAGDDARLNMDGQDNGGTDPMDDENKKTCTTMDDDTTVEPDKQTADDGEGASPAASSLDPAGIEAAIKAYLAATGGATADDENDPAAGGDPTKPTEDDAKQPPTEDEDDASDNDSGQLNHDSLDAIVKKKVGQRMELCRLGDKLHLDGMDTLPVMQAKKKVIRTVLPGMRLDGKGNAYINAAFDIAKGKVDGRKTVNDQRRQVFNADSANAATHNANAKNDPDAARTRMIQRHAGEKED